MPYTVNITTNIYTYMKKQLFALFTDPEVADKAINELHNDLDIDKDEISYVYRDNDGDQHSGTADDIATDTPAEGAEKGAKTGAVIGTVIGLAALAGLAGPLGPVLATGPLATALGIGGAVGTVAGGAAIGAVAGGLTGALVNLGLGETKAKFYEDKVMGGAVLVTIHTSEVADAVKVLENHGATDVEMIEVSV